MNFNQANWKNITESGVRSEEVVSFTLAQLHCSNGTNMQARKKQIFHCGAVAQSLVSLFATTFNAPKVLKLKPKKYIYIYKTMNKYADNTKWKCI